MSDRNSFLRKKPLRNLGCFHGLSLDATRLYNSCPSNGSIVGQQHSSARSRCALPLRIAITVDPEIPVSPMCMVALSESWTCWCAASCSATDMSLVANPESQVGAAYCLPTVASRKIDTLANMWHVSGDPRGTSTWCIVCPPGLPRAAAPAFPKS
jgi:hypothetical protein